MLSFISIRPYLGLEGLDRQRLLMHRLVVEAIALLVPEGVLHPVLVVAPGIVAASMRAAAFLARFGRDDGRHRRLDEVVQLEGFHSRSIERFGLVLDESSFSAGCDFLNFRH